MVSTPRTSSGSRRGAPFGDTAAVPRKMTKEGHMAVLLKRDVRAAVEKLTLESAGGRVRLMRLYTYLGLGPDDFEMVIGRAANSWLELGTDAHSELGFFINGGWRDWVKIR